MDIGIERAERIRRRILPPFEDCLICLEGIYPYDNYTFFADGYAHMDCIRFHRLQVELIKKSELID